MPVSQNVIRNYFSRLDLEPEIADIYTSLHSQGPQTISALARNTKIERTRIYRLIDKLLESNLIEIETHYKSSQLRAAPIGNLRILISHKEQQLASLQADLPVIEQSLASTTLSSPATRVEFYQGATGVKQMQWNLLRAKGPISSIMHRGIDDVTGLAFFARWAEKWNQGVNHTNLIVTQAFIDKSNAMHDAHPGNQVNNHHARLLDPKIYPITFCTDIYDDIVNYYNWQGQEVYGIEIHNQDIARAQQIFFDMLWKTAQPVTNDHGVKDWVAPEPHHTA